jgi:hypothetical protein
LITAPKKHSMMGSNIILIIECFLVYLAYESSRSMAVIAIALAPISMRSWA